MFNDQLLHLCLQFCSSLFVKQTHGKFCITKFSLKWKLPPYLKAKSFDYSTNYLTKLIRDEWKFCANTSVSSICDINFHSLAYIITLLSTYCISFVPIVWKFQCVSECVPYIMRNSIKYIGRSVITTSKHITVIYTHTQRVWQDFHNYRYFSTPSHAIHRLGFTRFYYLGKLMGTSFFIFNCLAFLIKYQMGFVSRVGHWVNYFHHQFSVYNTRW